MGGSKGNASGGERWGAADEASIARPPVSHSPPAVWPGQASDSYREAARGLGTLAIQQQFSCYHQFLFSFSDFISHFQYFNVTFILQKDSTSLLLSRS